jgi:hypothetical protein
MKDDKRNEYVTRDTILKLLSDSEVASVTAAETASHLSNGDEYLDLERLNQGVQQASGTTTPMGRVLPRKAMQEKTWNTILAHLAAPSGAMAHIGTSAAPANHGEMGVTRRARWRNG